MQPVVTLGCVESNIVYFVVEIGSFARGLNVDLYPRHGFTNGLATAMELDPLRRRLVANTKEGYASPQRIAERCMTLLRF